MVSDIATHTHDKCVREWMFQLFIMIIIYISFLLPWGSFHRVTGQCWAYGGPVSLPPSRAAKSRAPCGIRWCLCIDFISAKLCHLLNSACFTPQKCWSQGYTLVKFLPWYVCLGVCPPRNLRPGSWFQDKSEEAGSQVGFWNWTISWPTGNEDPIIGYQCRELEELRACWSAFVQKLKCALLNRPWA